MAVYTICVPLRLLSTYILLRPVVTSGFSVITLCVAPENDIVAFNVPQIMNEIIDNIIVLIGNVIKFAKLISYKDNEFNPQFTANSLSFAILNKILHKKE